MKFTVVSFILALTSQLTFCFVKIGEFETVGKPKKVIEYKGKIFCVTRTEKSNSLSNESLKWVECFDLSILGKKEGRFSFEKKIRKMKIIGENLYILSETCSQCCNSEPMIDSTASEEFIKLFKSIRFINRNQIPRDCILFKDDLYVAHMSYPILVRIPSKTSVDESIQGSARLVAIDAIFAYDEKLLVLECKSVNWKFTYSLTLYDATSFEPIKSIQLPAGKNCIAVEGSKAYIFNYLQSKILIIDLNAFEMESKSCSIVGVEECNRCRNCIFRDCKFFVRDGVAYFYRCTYGDLWAFDLNNDHRCRCVVKDGIRNIEISDHYVYVLYKESKKVSLYSLAPSSANIVKLVREPFFLQYFEKFSQDATCVNLKPYDTRSLFEVYDERRRSQQKTAAALGKNDSPQVRDHKDIEHPLGVFSRLPLEIFLECTKNLNFASIRSLSQTSKTMKELLKSEICQSAINALKEKILSTYVDWVWLAQSEAGYKDLMAELTEAVKYGDPVALKVTKRLIKKPQ